MPCFSRLGFTPLLLTVSFIHGMNGSEATAAAPLVVSPAAISYSAAAGAIDVPARQLVITSDSAGTAWTAQASTVGGGDWLSITPSSGSTPSVISVRVTVTGLASGAYRGTVTVSGAYTVVVELSVKALGPPSLVVGPSSLVFQGVLGDPAPPAQQLRITNPGAGTLQWVARVTPISGRYWLSGGPYSGTASSAMPATLTLTPDPGGLLAGVYSSLVTISSATTGQSTDVIATFLLSRIMLSHNAALFVAAEGVSQVPRQNLFVSNTGTAFGSVAAQATTLSGGNWLGVSATPRTMGASPSAATSPAAPSGPQSLELTANPAQLRSGQYSGLVRAEVPGAGGSPQIASAHFVVLPKTSNPEVVIQPTALFFTIRAGAAPPAAQTIRAATPSLGDVKLTVGVQMDDGGAWLVVQPRSAVFSAANPVTLSVQPTTIPWVGKYQGRLVLQFSDASPPQVVDVGLIAAMPLAALSLRTGAAVVCAPTNLIIAFTTLGRFFTATVGWPSVIQAQVFNDCGDPVPNASVVASFSSGDPPVVLLSLGNGTYSGFWQPLAAAAGVVLTVRAFTGVLSDEVQAQGMVSGNAAAVLLFPGGVVDAASYSSRNGLAPGSIVSVFGRNLSASVQSVSTIPLPVQLAGASLNVGGVYAPLFFASDGQVNAQIPVELAPDSRVQVFWEYRLEGSGNQQAAVPQSILITSAAPSIFTTNQQGTGQGAILHRDGQLADNRVPAKAGEIMQVFCTGLGATQPVVRSGQPGPWSEPLARVVMPVTATVGGKPAVVHFAGLAPGFVGLYQVNVQVPEGIGPGSGVPLTLTQNSVASNTVTIAIQ